MRGFGGDYCTESDQTVYCCENFLFYKRVYETPQNDCVSWVSESTDLGYTILVFKKCVNMLVVPLWPISRKAFDMK